MNHKLPLILAITMAVAIVSLYLSDTYFEPAEPVEVRQGTMDEVPESLRQITYTPPPNIYLPDLMFLRIDAGDSLAVEQCKNMTYRSVDDFSRQVNSNLVRADKKLRTLARITYDACLELQIAMIKG